jgi:hypothetical protein
MQHGKAPAAILPRRAANPDHNGEQRKDLQSYLNKRKSEKNVSGKFRPLRLTLWLSLGKNQSRLICTLQAGNDDPG